VHLVGPITVIYYDAQLTKHHELMYVHTIIISPNWFAAHNIPLQVNTDGGNMEMDISQGEAPKTNEQAENVMR
jgi:hypothetical protein